MFFKLVDFIIGDPESYDARSLLRSRASVTVLLAITLGFVAVTFLWLILADERQLIGYSGFLGALSAFGGALYIFYITKSLAALSNAFCFAMGAIVMTVVVVTGGFVSPALSVLIILPTLALVTTGIGHCLLWSGACLLAFLVLVYLHGINVELPVVMNRDNFDLVRAILWLFSASVVVFVLMLQDYYLGYMASRLYRKQQSDEEQPLDDSLTGLRNKAYCTRLSANLQERYKLVDRGFSRINLKLCAFDDINKHYGLEAGEYVLQDIATRLRANFRKADHLMRVERDEFVIITENRLEDADARMLASKLEAALEEEIYYDRAFIRASGSVTVAHYPQAEVEQETLVECQGKHNVEAAGVQPG